MKKLIVLALVLVTAGVVFAGEGKSCKRGDVQSVQLTGTISRAEGSGDDAARVFSVANAKTRYSICGESKVDLAALEGAQVRVTGKVVNCGEGKELLIDSASRI